MTRRRRIKNGNEIMKWKMRKRKIIILRKFILRRIIIKKIEIYNNIINNKMKNNILKLMELRK